MIESITNFRRIDADLLTAGQPTEEQFRALAEDGCRFVINLHTNDPRWALPDEPGLLENLGIEYHNIPVVFAGPTRADYERFATLMDERGGRCTLVHCVLNYRVTAFMALYGEHRLGWDRARADAFIADVWQPDEIWASFLEEMRGT